MDSVAPVTKLFFVTGNANKLKEFRQILSTRLPSAVSSKLEISSLSIDLPEVQGTIEEVAIAKIRAACREIEGTIAKTDKVIVVTEDTALCFNAMGELPGPYIKWFLKALGLNGLNNMLSGFDDKGARAVCTFGYVEVSQDGTSPKTFQGITNGKIVPPRGPENFGWDPIFEAENTGKTYAEMDSTQKNGISHRGRALEKMIAHLANTL